MLNIVLNIHPVYIVMNTGGYEWKYHSWILVYLGTIQMEMVLE